MNSVITAAILMCSSGDIEVANKIANEASLQNVNTVAALTVGIMESGLGRARNGNPMGVQGCYPKALAKNHRTVDECIRIGVRSLGNRILGAKRSTPSKLALHHCRGSGNLTMCRAMISYNGADNGRKYKYAKRAMSIARRIHELVGVKVPST